MNNSIQNHFTRFTNEEKDHKTKEWIKDLFSNENFIKSLEKLINGNFILPNSVPNKYLTGKH